METTTLSTLLRELGQQIGSKNTELQAVRDQMERELVKLKHKFVRFSFIEDHSLYRGAAIGWLMPEEEVPVSVLRRSCECDPRYGDPIIGIVTDYKIDNAGGVQLIIVVPGEKFLHELNPLHFEVEVLGSSID